jgi:hypothetical protein
MTLPEDWVIIPLIKEDLQVTLDKLGQKDPDIAKAAEAFKNLDSDVLRMAALNRKSKDLTGGYASNITVATIADPLFSVMPLSFITSALEESFTQPGMKVLTTGVHTIDNASSLEMEYMDVEQSISSIKFKGEIFQVAEQIDGSVEFI